ncbi:ankyrin repeat domain-containing protein [Fimbriimonas ginsengisoli]|uniref:Ankyrin n=1 Tax=Fimbriimonas ginsengisoli Gsoil 348 TaxID=661478 RepID=A0A068NYB7_FIMGI|nr:ankyrin repeat domain-containing protein [Fimbriimonas ginsengisoli]AIE86829.1 Ankyrin [Fimbriimonas ginsengisoli Gsoil 348]
MSTRTLPLRPNLAQLKLQATELRRQYRKDDPAALARVAAHHPKPEDPFKLADAQLVVAKEYGFDSWAKLKHFVETSARLAPVSPHPRFDDAVAAMDAGDVDRLRALLHENPELVHARTNLEPPYHYFTGATLLHHIAGNPDRGRLSGELGPMPENIVEVGRLLLDSGADVHATTLGPNGGRTMGLLVTSKPASDYNVSGPLIDLLLEYGDEIDLSRPDCLYPSLINHAPRAAERMIELGAKADLFAAAALGRLDLVKAAFDEKGRLRSKLKPRGRVLSQRDAIGLAMLVAYVRRQSHVVDYLFEKNGNWDMIGVNNGTALHRAAGDGDLAMVQRLVAKGANVNDRNNPFVATPLSWADHMGQPEVVRWIRENGKVDLHDAVSFGFGEVAETRLSENPASVNERQDQWRIPRATPLHCAAYANKVDMVRLLLDRGADPTLRAGNGQTPREIAASAMAVEAERLLSAAGVGTGSE